MESLEEEIREIICKAIESSSQYLSLSIQTVNTNHFIIRLNRNIEAEDYQCNCANLVFSILMYLYDYYGSLLNINMLLKYTDLAIVNFYINDIYTH